MKKRIAESSHAPLLHASRDPEGAGAASFPQDLESASADPLIARKIGNS